jgi:hypothetical protein
MQGLSHPLKPTALWGSGSASLKKAAICERQLNEARQYRGNFMSFFDDLPPAHSNPVLGQKLWQKAGHVMGRACVYRLAACLLVLAGDPTFFLPFFGGFTLPVGSSISPLSLAR